MKNVLVVDNQISNCNLLSKFLIKKHYEVETTTQGKMALEMFGRTKFDLVIADYNLPDMTSEKLFDELQKCTPGTRMIFMGKEVNLKNAVSMIRRGANNFISKPLNPDELLEAMVEASLSETSPISRKQNKVGSNSNLMSAHCPKVKALMRQAERVAQTDYSVIIHGETGTGKESFARHIHHHSNRKEGPFVAVDCGCLSKEIAASEFFGHEKGAFTGAISQKTGFFEQADGGTLFLDEIANLSLDIQTALLRALQEKVIRKIGGSKVIPIDIRIIVATNEDLQEKSTATTFREDLYFRLCEYTLEIPPLRDRKQDLPYFVDFFLEQTAIELKIDKPALNEEISAFLMEYEWPGNIREMRNVIRRLCLFIDENNNLQCTALPQRIKNFFHERDLKNKFSLTQTEQTTVSKEDDTALKATVMEAESQRILEVLEKVQYNKTKAAKLLDIHRKTLYMKLKQMNIQ
ncbi:sigma-54-dependent transcriptional regulator [Algoriphagus vanfongensis]|uniref:sigma-54-dependent transcriptional regulator n=1 Tax=Algoriphagus vanfongensis TaxID=426371 RepID=UPI0003FF0B5E|nr:sigma-54 dependent transcriptional regulator [Algoriphagus vanfongensis]